MAPAAGFKMSASDLITDPVSHTGGGTLSHIPERCVPWGARGRGAAQQDSRQQPSPSCAPQYLWPPCPPFPVPSYQQGGQGCHSDIVTFFLHCHPCCQCLLSEWGQPMECGRTRAAVRGDTSPQCHFTSQTQVSSAHLRGSSTEGPSSEKSQETQ